MKVICFGGSNTYGCACDGGHTENRPHMGAANIRQLTLWRRK